MTLLLSRAGAYVSDYERRFSALVAEERYVQEVRSPRTDGSSLPSQEARDQADASGRTREGASYTRTKKDVGARHREMRSDVLLVQLEDTSWFCFRDVIEVDGHKVRDREGRLQELFVKSRSSARTVMDESARYNIGPIERNNNLPTYALLFLAPDVQERFAFDKVGEQDVNGTTTWVVSFAETARPTIVRDRRGRDVPCFGHFWVDPRNGQVLMSEVVMGDQTSDARGRVQVTYRLDSALGILVPAEMRETYDVPSRPWNDQVVCTARYANFRRFVVTTDETIKIPK